MTRNAIGFKDSCDNCDGLAAAGSGILSRVSDACQITITEFSESYDTQPPMNERYVNYTLSDQERFELQSIIAERAGASDPAQASTDEDHPDCSTKREHELYFALMGLAGAVMSRRKEWENWEQGGIKVAPVVRKALRLDGYALSSTER